EPLRLGELDLTCKRVQMLNQARTIPRSRPRGATSRRSLQRRSCPGSQRRIGVSGARSMAMPLQPRIGTTERLFVTGSRFNRWAVLPEAAPMLRRSLSDLRWWAPGSRSDWENSQYPAAGFTPWVRRPIPHPPLLAHLLSQVPD